MPVSESRGKVLVSLVKKIENTGKRTSKARFMENVEACLEFLSKL